MLHNFINIGKWNELPKKYQSIVHSASHVANTIMMARYDAENPPALRRLIAGGRKIRSFPVPVLDASYNAANELYAEISAKNADFKKVYDSLVAFRNDQYLWWQVAEYGFDSYMVRTRDADPDRARDRFRSRFFRRLSLLARISEIELRASRSAGCRS